MNRRFRRRYIWQSIIIVSVIFAFMMVVFAGMMISLLQIEDYGGALIMLLFSVILLFACLAFSAMAASTSKKDHFLIMRNLLGRRLSVVDLNQEVYYEVASFLEYGRYVKQALPYIIIANKPFESYQKQSGLHIQRVLSAAKKRGEVLSPYDALFGQMVDMSAWHCIGDSFHDDKILPTKSSHWKGEKLLLSTSIYGWRRMIIVANALVVLTVVGCFIYLAKTGTSIDFEITAILLGSCIGVALLTYGFHYICVKPIDRYTVEEGQELVMKTGKDRVLSRVRWDQPIYAERVRLLVELGAPRDYYVLSNRPFSSYREAGHTDYYSLLKVLDRDGTQVIIPNDKQLYKLRAFAVLKNYIYSEETKVTRIEN